MGVAIIGVNVFKVYVVAVDILIKCRLLRAGGYSIK